MYSNIFIRLTSPPDSPPLKGVQGGPKYKIWTQRLMQKSWSNILDGHVSHWLFSLLSYTLQDHLPRSINNSGTDSPISIINVIFHRIAYKTVSFTFISTKVSFFHICLGLCQVDSATTRISHFQTLIYQMKRLKHWRRKLKKPNWQNTCIFTSCIRNIM